MKKELKESIFFTLMWIATALIIIGAIKTYNHFDKSKRVVAKNIPISTNINESNVIIFPDSKIENKKHENVFIPGFKLYTKVHSCGKNWHEYHRLIFELLYEQNHMKKIIKQESIDDKLLNLMNLENGNWVADVGAGQGNYTQEFRRIVGKNGKVYTTDIDPNSKEYIDWYTKCLDMGTFAKLGFRDCSKKLPNNLITRTNSYEDPMLPNNKFDWIFMNMVHVWANTEYNETMQIFANNLKKSMKKEGKIILTEIIYPQESRPEAHNIHISTLEGYQKRFENLGFKIEYIEIDQNGLRLIAILKK